MRTLGFEEHYTAGRVVEALRACGVDEIHTGIGKTGVVGIVRGKDAKSGRMMGLRADMDALPLPERNDFAWKSTTANRMHACGHDGHTTMLIGAAQYLAATRRFDGTAVLIFQPGEEGYAGARAMIQDGLFDRFPVDSVYAMHNGPMLPAGQFGVKSGATMAASDRIEIQITGRGGHGAHAYLTIDPVLVAAHMITAIQSIVSRNVKGADAAVVSICSMQAGDPGAASVIPGEARLVGTVRTFDPAVQTIIERRLNELCPTVASAFGATATLNYQRGYPATINSHAEAQFAGDVAASLVGEANVHRNWEASMGSEDFSFMLQKKPGAYLRLGQAGADGLGSCALHNSRYDFNDEVLPLGAAWFASLIEQGMPPKAA
jgi:amidohydrolase